MLSFFFPVFLILLMFFDSYLTLDFIFFYYTDEADFDDFIVMVYMVLFFFLMLSDYDTSIMNADVVTDYAEHLYDPRTGVSEVSISYAYYNLDLSNLKSSPLSSVSFYDKNYFLNLFKISSQSLDYLNNFVLLNLLKFNVKNDYVFKIPVNDFILKDTYALKVSNMNKYFYLYGITIDEDIDLESDDLYVYSLYLVLFDLDLSRLVLIINRLIDELLKLCYIYFGFIVMLKFGFCKDWEYDSFFLSRYDKFKAFFSRCAGHVFLVCANSIGGQYLKMKSLFLKKGMINISLKYKYYNVYLVDFFSIFCDNFVDFDRNYYLS